MKYQIEDGTIVDTKKAKQSWEEDTRWNGNNHISVNTGSQWEHEALYLSAKGRYYIVHESQWAGSAAFVPDAEAARWLLVNGKELPKGLVELAAIIEE